MVTSPQASVELRGLVVPPVLGSPLQPAALVVVFKFVLVSVLVSVLVLLSGALSGYAIVTGAAGGDGDGDEHGEGAREYWLLSQGPWVKASISMIG